MMNPEQIRQRIQDMLQQGPLAGLSGEIKLLLQSQLQALLTSADLVSREEFDVQSEALRRTRQRLEELEARLSVLEQQQP
ncbi:accessory factor UbiK family protein [Venatoribacter cucullus]|uniref:Ubiquinone biosynthesis accessory factor UbiK n=1 Tax=Venatoribacter cucullus TaxID=2661630 RepID=A0A9E8FNT3_9GAMM|nr:accessory factor UbiK family protein [Venatoribacter cucullus]QQD25220.1 accessory factor UbiK family protein [Venatoribacter cucullus]UZK04610.1 accessory factor UbiK family protein [Venatoribacter cucullus]